MATRHLLYFTSEARQLYRASGARLTHEADFGTDEAGIEAFSRHVARLRGGHLSVVADLSGEDFHEDVIPALRGSDRAAILERRLAQRYRDTRVAAAFSLGFIEGERRNERLLLASFANGEQFGPWLDAVARAGVTLAGVYSAPLLAPVLARRLGAPRAHALMVTLDSAGLRQSFIAEGRLRFARLERVPDTPSASLAALVRSETARLVQYLSTLRALPREGDPVSVFAVAPPGQQAAFEQALLSDARLTFHVTSFEEAARRVGLRAPSVEAGGEQLYLHLAARHAPREQFARGDDRQAFFLWRLQRGVLAAGALAFAACAVIAGARWVDVTSARALATAQSRDAATATAEYRRITSTFPVTQTTTDNLRATVDEFRTLAGRSSWPTPDLAHVSSVLERFPQLELDRIEWRVERESTLGATKPAAPAPGAPAAKAEAAADFARVVEVAGRVNAMRRSDYRGITGQVQEFANALRGDGAYRVLRTQLPFDVTSDSTLSGDIGEAESAEAPRFTVVIARRLR